MKKMVLTVLLSCVFTVLLAQRNVHEDSLKRVKANQPLMIENSLLPSLREMTDSTNTVNFFSDTARFVVKSLKINTPESEFMPLFFGESIYFTTSKKKHRFVYDTLEWKLAPRLQSIEATFPDSVSKDNRTVVSHTIPKPKTFNVAASHITQDLQTVYFTKSENDWNRNVIAFNALKDHNISLKKAFKDAKKRIDEAQGKGAPHRLAIYKAKINKQSWYAIEPFEFNNDSFSVAHPTLSPDGKTMFFSSDMPGGFGGADIYVTYWREGKWTQPKNLGRIVNSEYNEMFPFIHDDGNLYLSSNRPNGMGGYDIYEAMQATTGDRFSRVANVGAPINSAKDDFGLVLNEPKRRGYFTSNRDGNLDIFQLDVKLLNVSRNLSDGGKNVFGLQYLEMTGVVVDSTTHEPLTRVLVKLRDVEKDHVGLAYTDKHGKYRFQIRNEKRYQISVSKIGYHPSADYSFTTKGLTEQNPINIDVMLNPVHFKLTLKIQVVEDGAGEGIQEPIPDAEIELQDGDNDEILKRYADSEGKFSFILEQGKIYRLTISKKDYKTSLPYKLSTANTINSRTIEVTIPLSKLLKIDKKGYFVRATVMDNVSNNMIPHAKVLLRNVQTKEVKENITDDAGLTTFEIDTAYNYLLESQKEAYQLNEYGNVFSKGIREGEIVEVMLPMKPVTHTPVPLDLSFEAIYYAESKTTFDDNIRKELDKVVETLNQYPSLKISIAAHADNTEGKEAAQETSRRRANAVFTYLTKKGVGISADRIIGVTGFGSTQMLIDCDKIDCDNIQQRQNRRLIINIVER